MLLGGQAYIFERVDLQALVLRQVDRELEGLRLLCCWGRHVGGDVYLWCVVHTIALVHAEAPGRARESPRRPWRKRLEFGGEERAGASLRAPNRGVRGQRNLWGQHVVCLPKTGTWLTVTSP